MNLVCAIWEGFDDAWNGWFIPDLPSSNIKSINQCRSMSDGALRYGCDIDNSIAFNSLKPNPLFNVVDEYGRGIPPQVMMEALQYLCNIGYDIEERNSEGLTLLLFEATQIDRSVISVLKFLIEKGADLHAVDLYNRGALHLALRAHEEWGSWDSFCTDDCDHSGSEHEASAWCKFSTESESYAEDYCNDGLIPAPSAVDEEDEVDEDDEVDLRFKLLTLLRAGCDPNLLDKDGASPSDDARKKGVWPEWTWALLNAGYVFDEDSNRWMRRLEEEVSFGE